jgi:hypothetical protein
MIYGLEVNLMSGISANGS